MPNQKKKWIPKNQWGGKLPKEVYRDLQQDKNNLHRYIDSLDWANKRSAFIHDSIARDAWMNRTKHDLPPSPWQQLWFNNALHAVNHYHDKMLKNWVPYNYPGPQGVYPNKNQAKGNPGLQSKQQGGKMHHPWDWYQYIEEPKRQYNYVEPREVQDNRYHSNELNAAYQAIPEDIRTRAQQVYDSLITRSNLERNRQLDKLNEGSMKAQQEAWNRFNDWLDRTPAADTLVGYEVYGADNHYSRLPFFKKMDEVDRKYDSINNRYLNTHLNTLRVANPTFDSLIRVSTPANQMWIEKNLQFKE